MWNPLAALPASNIGALASYAPQVMPNPATMQALHPIFGRHGHGPNTQFPLNPDSQMNGVADPNSFHSAMQAWRSGRPDNMAKFDPRTLVAGLPPGMTFDQMRTDYQQNTFDPWQQSMMDWRGARPLRSDF